MSNEETQEVTPETGNETPEAVAVETPEAPESSADDLNARLEKLETENGSLKRDLKKATKPKEEPTKADDGKQPDNLLQKAYLRSADIVEEDEVDLALETANKWDVSVDKLVDDEDFQVKLKKLRTNKANELATSNVRGNGGKSTEAKNTSAHWLAKGVPPTPEQVPDSKARRAIVRDFVKAAKGGGKTFYNE